MPDQCLLNGLFRRRSKKTSKLRVTGLCARNSPVTGEFLAQMASNAEMFPSHDVIMAPSLYRSTLFYFDYRWVRQRDFLSVIQLYIYNFTPTTMRDGNIFTSNNGAMACHISSKSAVFFQSLLKLDIKENIKASHY